MCGEMFPLVVVIHQSKPMVFGPLYDNIIIVVDIIDVITKVLKYLIIVRCGQRKIH